MANNLIANRRAFYVAIANASFASLGLNSSNIYIIQQDGDLRSWRPDRPLNSIFEFILGRGYYIVPRADLDLTAVLVPPISGVIGGGSFTPSPPNVFADDNNNTLQFTHSLGPSEMLISVNFGPFIQYDGLVINVGNFNRTAGYWRSKTRAVPGRNESPIRSSPAFNVGGVDTTRPTVVSMTVIDAGHIRVIFSETVSATAAGWSFNVNRGGSQFVATPNGPFAGGGNTWDYATIQTIQAGDVVTAGYNESTGNTADPSGNELAAFSMAAVTNNLSGGGGDTTAPTILSRTALNSTTIRVAFSEAMGSVTAAGHTFNNGSLLTPSSVSLVGGNTYDFTVSGLAAGQTITHSFNSGTGNTKDAANNSLVSFSNAPVTNSISGGGGGTVYDTVLTFGSATNSAGGDGNAVEAVVLATNGTLKFEFNSKPATGLPCRMDIFVSGTEQMAVNFPDTYLGAAYRFTDLAGTTHTSTFVNADANF